MSTTKWATEADFAEHRATITSLYRQKPLVDVMEHMRGEHQFQATARMYKARLKRWHVSKHVRYRTDDAQCQTSKTPHAPVGDAARSIASRQPALPTVAPGLGAPVHQQKGLDCLKILGKYVDGNPTSGRWQTSPTFMASLQNSDWLAQITTVTILLKGGQVQTGFHLLGGCFDTYKTNLKAESPLLTSETFMAAFQLMSISLGLGWSFLKYTCQLSGIVLENEAFANCSDLFLGCFLNMMKQHLSGWDDSHRDALLLTTGRMFLLSLTTFSQYQELTRMSKSDEAMPLLGHQHVLQCENGELPPAATRSETLSLYPLHPAQIKVMKQDPGGIDYLSFEML
ncbi:Clr5 domain protein [Aspergillus parasiticus SU-1]|uniref:Clr5 domain protein n=1 Tax=Aspergillus parasiticus (strain ATCC 56775 / NRRL 5862 / SRRC 143 / SU-1) TaxID=1403190 RepID=A0A0F0I7S1_ASPPU|nr:Clr5 domain protein [Aspergillus parasiticus SU-1]